MTNPNDPVHPTIVDLNPTGHLTKREYFAAMAMQGLPAWHGLMRDDRELEDLPNIIAREAAKLADALIAELNKGAK